VAAQRALNDAINHGAEPAELAPLQQAVAAAEDTASGIGRITEIAKLFDVPAMAAEGQPRLLLAGGRLYLIAGGVYLVGEHDAAPQPVLTPGQRKDGVKAGTIVDAAVDGGELVVSDGATLFRLRDDGGWDALALPDGSEDGWTGDAAGAFKGSFYLLDPENGQIVKFAGSALDNPPSDWLASSEPSLANAVDMEIDGSIRVLLADGTIITYFKGDQTGSVSAAGPSGLGSFVALAPSASEGVVYAVEIEGGSATLVRVDLTSGETVRLAALTSWHAGYDASATRAFGETVDFAVDEATNTLYFVTDRAVWSATLPALG
jgi:hypothetical protein